MTGRWLAATAYTTDNHVMVKAYIGVGSNLGDRETHVRNAEEALTKLPHTQLVAFSPIYENDADSPIPQGPFLNAAAEVHTELHPQDLHEALQEIERRSGRQRADQRVKWGPRTLDLDLLLYGQEVISTDALIVPHPMMHDRWFVLKPLSDLAPNAVHPLLQMTVGSLLKSVERLRPSPRDAR